jgi:hypothetical protein
MAVRPFLQAGITQVKSVMVIVGTPVLSRIGLKRGFHHCRHIRKLGKQGLPVRACQQPHLRRDQRGSSLAPQCAFPDDRDPPA